MPELNPLVLADIFLSKAETKPDHQIVIFEGADIREDENRTYQDLWLNAQRIAAGLIAKGMQYGDRFSILIRNHPEFIETMIAASLTGCVFIPIDPRTKGRKLAYTLNNSESKGIICADYSVLQLEEIRQELTGLEWIWLMETGEDGHSITSADIAGSKTLSGILGQPEASIDRRLKDPMDPVQIIYTSGTTGDPKGVVIPNVRLGAGVMGGAALGFEPDDKPYTGLSLTHGNAQSLTFMPAIGMDLPVVISQKFTKSRLWDITRKYGCTVFNLLGGMTTAIYSDPIKENDRDNPVRMVCAAGMPANIWVKFEERFNVKVLEMYGAVDGFGLIVNAPGAGPVGSFGKAGPNLEVAIVDEEDKECPRGEMGELIGRQLGAQPKIEYLGNEAASSKKTRGGWVRTGDICHMDENGYLYFDYRKGGGLRHNGDFVSPSFVEQVLAEHPQIDDVYVYGVTAASGAPGEKDVVGAIVGLDGTELDIPSIFAYCKKHLEANFIPSYLQVVKEIPKTASEKPQERFLLEAFSVDGEGIYTS